MYSNIVHKNACFSCFQFAKINCEISVTLKSLGHHQMLCKSLLRQLMHLEIFTDKDIRLFSFLVSFSQGNVGIGCQLHFLENRKGSI